MENAATVVAAAAFLPFCFFLFASRKKTRSRSRARVLGPAREKGRALTSGMGAGCCAAWVNTSELDARHGNVRFAFRLPDLFSAGGQNVRLHAMAAGGLMFER